MGRTRTLVGAGVAVALGFGSGAPPAGGQEGREGATAGSASGPTDVTVTLLPGLTDALPLTYDINDRGQVVGEDPADTTTPFRHAVLWEEAEEAIDLTPDFPEIESIWGAAMGLQINNRGQVAGVSSGIGSDGFWGESWLWENGERYVTGPHSGGELGTVSPLVLNERGDLLVSCVHEGQPPEELRVCVIRDGNPIPAPDIAGQPLVGSDMNNFGVVAANTADAAYVWPVGQEPRQLALPDGSVSARANYINDRGDVVGTADYPGGDDTVRRVVRWRNGQPTDLGTLGGPTSELPGVNNWTTVISPINEWGHIVGTSTTAEGESHAFIWRDGHMTDLGTEANVWTAPITINEWGQVLVGRVLWQNGRTLDLTEVIDREIGGGYFSASGINNRGQVAGSVSGAERTALTINVPVLWGYLGR